MRLTCATSTQALTIPNPDPNLGHKPNPYQVRPTCATSTRASRGLTWAWASWRGARRYASHGSPCGAGRSAGPDRGPGPGPTSSSDPCFDLDPHQVVMHFASLRAVVLGSCVLLVAPRKRSGDDDDDGGGGGGGNEASTAEGGGLLPVARRSGIRLDGLLPSSPSTLNRAGLEGGLRMELGGGHILRSGSLIMSQLTENLNSTTLLEGPEDIESLVRTLREAVESAEEADACFPLLMVDALLSVAMGCAEVRACTLRTMVQEGIDEVRGILTKKSLKPSLLEQIFDLKEAVREEQTEAEAVEAALERELDSSSGARLAFGTEDVEDDFKMVVEQHLQAACASRALHARLTSALESQERLILLMLDSWRNRWLKAEVVATALGTGAGCAALVSSTFGQNNLPIQLVPDDNERKMYSFVLSVTASILLVVLITSLGIIYTFCGGKSTRLLTRRAYATRRLDATVQASRVASRSTTPRAIPRR